VSVYTSQDIQVDIDGDIELSTRGDLELASSLDTYKNAANFLLRTDFGDYAPNKSVGSNLGTFIGKRNTSENHEYMEQNIKRCLTTRLFSASDVDVTVVPFDINEALGVINIGGSYLIDGILQTVNGETITYSFPFIEGSFITPLTVD
jgi:hypothetical protein